MANYENLIPFDKRTESEQRKIRSAGGKASGEVRRRKADFRRTLNLLLTAEIDSPEWTPMLKSLGLDSTLEAAVNAAMIKEALNGNVKAYEAIAKYAGQSAQTERDDEEQQARVGNIRAKIPPEDKEELADDGFLDALKGTAAEDWADEEES